MRIPPPTEKSGPLAGHVRKGRTYRSPLAATGVLQAGNWVQDDLPDLLWPLLVLSELGTAEGVRFVRWQKAVQGDLAGKADARFIAECLDGRLTSLDRLAARLPEAAAAVRTRAQQHGLLPPAVSNALASYPGRPASWLAGDETVSAGEDEIRLLAHAVLGVLQDGHREAVIKCLWIWSAVHAGTFRTDSKTIELLKAYPTDPGTRAAADSAVRAMWGARGILPEESESREADTVEWAKKFWAANSVTTRCLRLRQVRADEHGREEEPVDNAEAADSAEEPASSGPAPGGVPGDGAHLRQLAMDLFSSYVEALETAPSRLYDREQQEVHSGLVARAARDVITALGAPDLWCMEHGAHITRMLVEVRIYIEWMARQDPSVYAAFQDYGAGKAKLYALIMEELPPEARHPDHGEAVTELKTLSLNSEVLDNRVVDTRDSFADGKSIRAMAEECGLLDLYRHAYQMASGVAHSEWWSVQNYAMEQCLNVLHGGHLIPSLALSAGENAEFASTWVDHLYTLIRASLQILGTDKDAVGSAFAWLEDERDEESPDSGEEAVSGAAG